MDNISNYLDRVMPQTANGKWVYENNIVSFTENPTAKQEKKLENALCYMSDDFAAFCNTLDQKTDKEAGSPELREKLVALKKRVRTEVTEYHNRHSKIYFFFRKFFYGDVDQIANNLIAHVERLETRLNPALQEHIVNPNTNNANLLPLPAHLFGNIAQFLDVNDLVNVGRVSKSGTEVAEAPLLLKAQAYGYQGNDI